MPNYLKSLFLSPRPYRVLLSPPPFPCPPTEGVGPLPRGALARDPAVYELAVADAGCPVARCIAVEDSPAVRPRSTFTEIHQLAEIHKFTNSTESAKSRILEKFTNSQFPEIYKVTGSPTVSCEVLPRCLFMSCARIAPQEVVAHCGL